MKSSTNTSPRKSQLGLGGIAAVALAVVLLVGVVLTYVSFASTRSHCGSPYGYSGGPYGPSNPYNTPYSSPYGYGSGCYTPYGPGIYTPTPPPAVAVPVAAGDGTPPPFVDGTPPPFVDGTPPPFVDGTPPAFVYGAFSATGKGKKLAITIPFQCPSEACNVSATLVVTTKKPKKKFNLAFAGSSGGKPGAGTITFVLGKKVQAALKKAPRKLKIPLTLIFSATASDAAGNAVVKAGKGSVKVKHP